MARNLLLGTGGVAALTLLALGAANRGTLAGKPAAQGEPHGSAPRAGAGSRADPADGEGPGSSLLARYLGVDDTATRQRIGSGYTIGVLIATVPDPVDSSLDWAFDTYVASIRAAYEASGYVLDGASLPWFDATGSLRQRGPDEDVARWETTPGVMLFRNASPRADSLRLLYLVGETPTGGVAKAALAAALKERAELLRPGRFGALVHPREIRVVGPVFSGSAVSLRLVLESWLATHRDDRDGVRLLSGTATSRGNLEELTGSQRADPGCSDMGKPLADGEVCFAATVHCDDDLRWLLLDTLARLEPSPGVDAPGDAAPEEGRGNVHPVRIALLEEASTVYGQTASQGPGKADATAALTPALLAQPILSIPFPMNISSLRTAYAENPQPAQQAGAPAAAPDSRVPLSLQEQGHHKGVFAPASALTTSYLDLFLGQVVATIADRNINLVGIVATDIRDKLFLAGEIRKRLPGVQLFTLESNTLYLWPEYNDAFRGMLVFSSYPLYHRNQLWVPSAGRSPGPARSRGVSGTAREHDHEPGAASATPTMPMPRFSSDGAEGIYNATLLQLDATRLVDYAPPTGAFGAANDHRPPIWMTAVGRTSFLPLRLAPAPAQTKAYLVPGPAGMSRSSWQRLPMPLILQAAIVLLGIPSIVPPAVFLLNRARRRRRTVAAPPDLPGATGAAHGPPSLERVSLDLHHEIYAGALFLTLGNIFLPALLMATGYFRGFETPFLLTVLLAALLAVLGVAAAAAGVGAAGIVIRHFGAGRRFAATLRPPAGSWREYGMWHVELLARAGIVGMGIWLSLRYYQFLREVAALANAQESAGRTAIGPLLLFYQHLVQLDSGLSPLPPLLLIGLILAAGYSWNLRRIQLLRAGTPFERALAALPAPEGWGEIATDVHRVRRRLARVVPDAGALALAVATAATALFLWPRFGWSLETLVLGGHHHGLSAFDLLLRLGVLLAVGTIPWGVYRFFSVWSAFHELLRRLALTPLVAAFDRLPAGISRLSGLLWADPAGSPRLAAAAGTAWRQLRAVPRVELDAIDRLLDPAPTDRLGNLLDWSAAGSDAGDRPSAAFLAAVAGELMPRVSTLWDGSTAGDGPAGKPADGGPVGSPHARWQARAEEFLAVQVVGYVEHVIGQLWSLAVVLLVSVALVATLVASYPFGPQALVRLVFMVALSGAAALFIGATVQMSRDEVLSHITKTDPGKITWDVNLVAKLVLFGLGPLAALVGSQFAGIRTALTSWIQPLLEAITRG